MNHTLHTSNLLYTLARYDCANDGVLVASYDNDTVIMMAVITQDLEHGSNAICIQPSSSSIARPLGSL